MNSSLISRIVRFVEKHTKGIIISIIIIAFLVPISINMVFCLTHNCHLITADGYLEYSASIITGFISLLLGAIAIYQGNRANMIQKGIYDKERKNAIRPIFFVSIGDTDESSTTIIVENISDNIALNIDVLGEDIPYLKAGHKETISSELSIDNSQIKRLMICFSDIDGNVITIHYRYIGNGRYSFYVDDWAYEESEGE